MLTISKYRMIGYNTGAKETKQSSRLHEGNRNLLHQNWLMGGGKRLFRFFYKTTSLKTFTTLTNLDCSMNIFQIKSIKSEKCSGRKLSKICIAGLEVANAAGHKLPMFATGKAKK